MTEPLVLTLDEVADELLLTATSQHERRRQVRELIAAGELRVVNPSVGPRRWRVSRYEMQRFLQDPSYTERAS